MNIEIPEWAIRDAEKSLKGIYPEMVSPQAFLYLREAIASALVAQMEGDCRAVCEWCKDGHVPSLYQGYWSHIIDLEDRSGGPCLAHPIRAAAEATRTEEGSGGEGELDEGAYHSGEPHIYGY